MSKFSVLLKNPIILTTTLPSIYKIEYEKYEQNRIHAIQYIFVHSIFSWKVCSEQFDYCYKRLKKISGKKYRYEIIQYRAAEISVKLLTKYSENEKIKFNM